jgi:hypothetical protein
MNMPSSCGGHSVERADGRGLRLAPQTSAGEGHAGNLPLRAVPKPPEPKLGHRAGRETETPLSPEQLPKQQLGADRATRRCGPNAIDSLSITPP